MITSIHNAALTAWEDDQMIDAPGPAEQLEMEIHLQEIRLARLEAEISDLERDLAPFRARYARMIQPIVERLEAVKAAVAETENYFTTSRPCIDRPDALSPDLSTAPTINPIEAKQAIP